MNKVIKQKRTPGSVVYKAVVSDKTKGLEFILSDATPDRYDDIIMTSGWELANFNNNPIALFAHMGSFPVGTWKSVRVEDGALRGVLVLADEGVSERIDEIRKLVDANILKAVSVGFTPIEYEERQGDTYGIVYTRQELVECSLVSVPANPNALQVAKALKISDDTRGLVFREPKLIKSAKSIEHCGGYFDALDGVRRLDIEIERRESLIRPTHTISELDNDSTLQRLKKKRKSLQDYLKDKDKK